MSKKKLAEAQIVRAKRWLKEFDGIEPRTNDLEEEIGSAAARAWSIHQMTTLNPDQRLAMRFVLFEQRREILGGDETLQSAVRDYLHAMENIVLSETIRERKIKEAVADSWRVQNADEYLKIASQVIARGLKGSDAKAEYDNECKRRGLAVHSDTQRRHYLRKARKFE